MNDKVVQLLLGLSSWRVGVLGGQLIALGAVCAATLCRWAAFPLLGTEVSFMTAAPAVFVATLLGGRLAGATTILAGSGIDLIIASTGGPLTWGQAAPRLIVWLGAATIVMLMTVGLRVTIHALSRREAELVAAGESRLLLIQELEHRGRNALTIVQSLSNEVSRNVESIAEYRSLLNGRLVALATSYSELTRVEPGPVDLMDLLRKTLQPFGRRIEIASGPQCRVAPTTTLALTLALHELATNALKYGSLSAQGGRVLISWSLQRPEGIHLKWIETGGPPPKPSHQEGFGSKLLQGLVRTIPGASYHSDLGANGFLFELTVPAS